MILRKNKITKRFPVWATAMAAAAAGLGCATTPAGPKARPGKAARKGPNVIFIFTDDHASHAISAYGSKINKTPNLDRLANEGMLFRNCFVTNSICAPSRAVILTGKHSHINGVIDNRVTFDGAQRTFPQLLQQAGYQTAMIGKWHLKSSPTGFDYWEVLPGQGNYYNPDFKTADGKVKYTGYVTDIITDRVIDWLKNKRDSDKPFMVMYQHKAPHREWEPDAKHLTMYDDVTVPEPATLFDDYAGRSSAAKMQEMTIANHMRWVQDLKVSPDDDAPDLEKRGYTNMLARMTDEQREAWKAAYEPKNEAFKKANLEGKDLIRWKYQRYIKDYLRCIASVDDNVGRLLKYLDDAGLADDTVVIYSSDQGFYLGDHGWYDKRWMYEESLRMPLIVRWPGKVKPGSENRDLVQNLDFAETFLEMAGVQAPPDMQGRSIVPLLEGRTPKDWRKSIYYHYWEYPAVHMVNRHYGVRTDRYKLIHYYQLKEWELFDLQKDPDELRSVYDEPAYAGQVKALKAELKRLQERYKDTDPEGPRSQFSQRGIRAQARKIKLEKVMELADREAKPLPSLDPAGKPLTVGACCVPAGADGVVIAQGGGSLGYSLYIKGGVPHFAVRDDGSLLQVAGPDKLPMKKPVHLAGVLNADGRLLLYVDGKCVGKADGQFLSSKPDDGLCVGADNGSQVGSYKGPMKFEGVLRDIRIYWGVLDEAGLQQWAGGCR